MEENYTSDPGFLETEDCLKTAGVFKKWKTTLLFVVAGCLLLQQTSFYLLDQGYIKISDQVYENEPAAANRAEQSSPVMKLVARLFPGDAASRVNLDKLTQAIKLINAILISAAVLYCLTLLLNLEISLRPCMSGMNHIARSFGIKHIARAFMLSLLMVVLLLPWQTIFGGVVTGAVFTHQEMIEWHSAKPEDALSLSIYYLRFFGYGLAMFLLLILSNSASLNWARAILRRTDVKQAVSEDKVERDRRVSTMMEPKPVNRKRLRKLRRLTISIRLLILSTILLACFVVAYTFWSEGYPKSRRLEIVLGLTYILLGISVIAACLLLLARESVANRRIKVHRDNAPEIPIESKRDSPFPIRILPAPEIANNIKTIGNSMLKRLRIEIQRDH